MSTLKYNTWLNTDNTENYKCRAWVNFNGQGTVAIRGSGNVSSITDNGTGDYSINFTNAMPDTNYSVSGLTPHDNGSYASMLFLDNDNTPTTTSRARVNVLSNGFSLIDVPFITIQIVR